MRKEINFQEIQISMKQEPLQFVPILQLQCDLLARDIYTQLTINI